MYNDSLFNAFARSFEARSQTDMSMAEYLESCRSDPMRYANAAERLLAAIGEPQMIDTAKDPRLGRIFLNRTIRSYPAFAGFHGMEDTIERIVGFFRHAAQGLEERKQILYSARTGRRRQVVARRAHQGADGSSSDLRAEGRRRTLAGVRVAAQLVRSGSARPDDRGEVRHPAPPAERADVARGPTSGSRPSAATSRNSALRASSPRGCARSRSPRPSPGDENNQDISSLVGKVDIRKLETYAQNDPDAYSYSGGLNRANQGVLEFVEMFKAPIKMLHPLLTATQEGNYIGTENIGAIPFTGIILAHSNEAEWQSFKTNKNNEAFIDRICVIKVPYCLRVTEEQKIYDKLIESSELAAAPCAPATLETLARFSVMSRLRKHENSTLFAKMRVYDGESLKESDPKARSVQEYKDAAGVDEGMDGVSTRFAFKVLASTFNHDTTEVGADAVHLMYVLEQSIRREQLPDESREALSRIHQGRPRAALRRVHRQRDPEGLSGILRRLRPEPVRPLCRLRRRLDRGSGLQGSRHRPADEPRASQSGTDQDREAGWHRQPEGLPQRGRQVPRCARARTITARTRAGPPTKRSAT